MEALTRKMRRVGVRPLWRPIQVLVTSSVFGCALAAGQAPSKPQNATLQANQQRGMKLLGEAEGQAASLPPEMRAFVLLQAAQGYKQSDPGREVALLRQAFGTTTAIATSTGAVANCVNGGACQTREWLQPRILRQLLELDPREAEKLMAESAPSVRQSLEGDLVAQYVRERSFDRALEIVNRLSDQQRFPYWAVAELIAALPEEQGAQQVEAFHAAERNFLRYGDRESFIADHFVSLVTEFGDRLPAVVVQPAIGDLLESSRASSDSDHVQVTLSGSEGVVVFTSAYEYRLFQLLPVLRRVDPTRSQALLRQHPEVQAALQQFPDGPRSLRATDPNGVQVSYGEPGFVGSQLQDMADAQANHAQNEAIELARKDPKLALQKALALPEWSSGGPGTYSPRAVALRFAAGEASRNDPETARQIAAELLKLAAQMNPADSGSTLASVAGIYLALGDGERARAPLESARKVADILYARDSDISDPNQFLKAFWPSTHLWWRLVRLSAELSPQAAERLIASIPDPEIRALQKVNLGGALLGAPNGLEQALERHRDGKTRIAAY